MLQRNPEKTFEDRTVEVHGHQTPKATGSDQVGDEAGSHGLAAGGATVLARVTKIRNYCGQIGRARTATSVGQEKQGHEMLIDRRPGGLDDVDVVAAHGFLKLHMQLP